MADLRYPIGPFVPALELTDVQRKARITEIALTPRKLQRAVLGLNAGQLDTRYRERGWTIRQVAHHLPDSHLNGYTRLKLALTEDEPTIRPYDQAAWAELPDVQLSPVSNALHLLESLHVRFTALLRSLEERDFRRTFRHPEHGVVTIDWLLAMYSWHGRHHVAQITSLRDRRGW
jgi:hypothetical protein